MARIPPVDYREVAWKDVVAALGHEVEPSGPSPLPTAQTIEAHEQGGADCAWSRSNGREGCGGCLRQDFLVFARRSIEGLGLKKIE